MPGYCYLRQSLAHVSQLFYDKTYFSESILVKGSKVVSYDNSGGSEILCSPVRGKVLCGISLYN